MRKVISSEQLEYSVRPVQFKKKKTGEKKKSWFISFKLKKNCVNKVLPTDTLTSCSGA